MGLRFLEIWVRVEEEMVSNFFFKNFVINKLKEKINGGWSLFSWAGLEDR